MDAELLPHGHDRPPLPGAEDLAELAELMAETTRQCRNCISVSSRDILLAMAEAAEALAAQLRERAGAMSPFPPMSPTLAAMYEKYIDRKAVTEDARCP